MSFFPFAPKNKEQKADLSEPKLVYSEYGSDSEFSSRIFRS
jgi:hypothetical protein